MFILFFYKNFYIITKPTLCPFSYAKKSMRYVIMKDSLIKQCLDILKTEDVRNEIKVLFSPVTDIILYEIYPYIYGIIFLVFLIFIGIFTILILLSMLFRIISRNKTL